MDRQVATRAIPCSVSLEVGDGELSLLWSESGGVSPSVSLIFKAVDFLTATTLSLTLSPLPPPSPRAGASTRPCCSYRG